MLKPQFRQTDAKASTAVDSGGGYAALVHFRVQLAFKRLAHHGRRGSAYGASSICLLAVRGSPTERILLRTALQAEHRRRAPSNPRLTPRAIELLLDNP